MQRVPDRGRHRVRAAEEAERERERGRELHGGGEAAARPHARAPKIAVPTRTRVAPSAMAIGEIVGHAHR